MIHWTQQVYFGKMQHYDFRDSKKNQQHYGQSHPPPYNLNEIVDTKIHLYSSKSDYLADSTDIEQFLIPNLRPNIVQVSKNK
jgi:lysosomal acid lipase/cholesteryl ester hydrolase